jgi:ribose transport system permease protein
MSDDDDRIDRRTTAIGPTVEPSPGGAIEETEELPPPTRWQLIVGSSTVWIFAILILIVVVFTAYEPSAFPTVANFRNIATDASVLLILAVGETFVIITAGIDLSVGSVLLFGGVIAAKVMSGIGGSSTGVIVLGMLAALASGAAWGLFNGVVITKMKVPPLIVTLGTLGMALGAALLLTGGVDVRDVPFNLVTSIGIGRVGGVPYLVLIAGGVAIFFGLLLAITRFGRWTYGIGSNAEAARRAGINVDTHLIKIYALAGLLAGLAGWLNLARFSTTTLGGHATDNLNAIAGVVIGGTSLFGGVGTIAGTVVGVFIPAVLQNGFNVIGVQPFWQDVAVGAVLIIAVYLDQLRRRAKQQV